MHRNAHKRIRTMFVCHPILVLVCIAFTISGTQAFLAHHQQGRRSTIISVTEAAIETTKDGVYIVDSMPEPLPENLKNTYYLLRHGQSWGNVAGVISSARSLAFSEKHSLTPLGYEQGFNSAQSLLSLVEQQLNEEEGSKGSGSTKEKTKRLFFYSSPFSR